MRFHASGVRGPWMSRLRATPVGRPNTAAGATTVGVWAAMSTNTGSMPADAAAARRSSSVSGASVRAWSAWRRAARPSRSSASALLKWVRAMTGEEGRAYAGCRAEMQHRGRIGSGRGSSKRPSARAAPVYLVLLDAYHLDDLLFLGTLGRLMAAAPREAILVHGDGGLAARALEAKGYFPGDALNEDALALVAAAHVQQNRRLVAALNDAGVPAVGLLGSDRRMLVKTVSGQVLAGKTGWLSDLASRGAVPVVAALALDGVEVPIAVAPEAALAVFRVAVPGTAVAFTRTGRPGLGTPPVAVLEGDDLSAYEAELADPAAVRALAHEGVLVTSPPGLWASGGAAGTEILPKEPEKAAFAP